MQLALEDIDLDILLIIQCSVGSACSDAYRWNVYMG